MKTKISRAIIFLMNNCDIQAYKVTEDCYKVFLPQKNFLERDFPSSVLLSKEEVLNLACKNGFAL